MWFKLSQINGSIYVCAGKLLEAKRPNLYCTPCGACCIDMMLEDIKKIPLIKKKIQRGVSLVGFIYSHSINKRELVRHAVTRFVTFYLSLQRLYQEKGSLRKMFNSDEWSKNKLCTRKLNRKNLQKLFLYLHFGIMLYLLSKS